MDFAGKLAKTFPTDEIIVLRSSSVQPQKIRDIKNVLIASGLKFALHAYALPSWAAGYLS